MTDPDDLVECDNCGYIVDCMTMGIFCIYHPDDPSPEMEMVLCQECFQWDEKRLKKDGWKCDDWDDPDLQ